MIESSSRAKGFLKRGAGGVIAAKPVRGMDSWGHENMTGTPPVTKGAHIESEAKTERYAE